LPFCSITLTAQKPTKLPRILNTIGDHIKKRRLELGLFQKQVAEIIGVDECTVTNWEKGRTSPALRLLPKTIGFLGYSTSIGDTDTVGAKLLRYRKSRGMTQKGLAKQIGIDATTLGRIEKGRGRCLEAIRRRVSVFLTSSDFKG
jgi:DNA-binding XRE family transcriptional regulator